MISATVRRDSTGLKQDTRFQPGQSGNPAGRPKGSRNKLSENFINAFAQDFEQHGAAVIERVRKERPQDYLKVAASQIIDRVYEASWGLRLLTANSEPLVSQCSNPRPGQLRNPALAQ